MNTGRSVPQYQPLDYTPPSYDTATQPLVPKTMPQEIHEHYASGLAELEKMGAKGLGGKFQVCLALDISASMQNPNKFFYDEHKEDDCQYPVQELITQALSLGYLLDDDNFATVFPFGDQAYGPLRVDQSNYENLAEHFYKEDRGVPVVDQLKDHTDYVAVVNAIKHHYTAGKTAKEIQNMAPVFVIFATDGNPNPLLANDPMQPHDKLAGFQPYPAAFAKSKNKMDGLQQVQKIFADVSGLPFYFVFLGMKGEDMKKHSEEQQFADLKKAANYYQRDKKNIPQNMDLLVVDHPEDLEMHSLIRKLPHWLIQAYNKKVTSINVNELIDIKQFNRYERRLEPCWANLFCCAKADPYEIKHHDENHLQAHHAPTHNAMK